MRYFIVIYTLSIYLFAYNYQPRPITLDESGEYVIIDSLGGRYFEDLDNQESLIIQETSIYEEEANSTINYIDLKEAREEAKIENKFLLVKIESDNCPTCSKLNILLDNNENIKSMVNEYTKAVKFNSEYDQIPPRLEFIGTPTLFLLDSQGKKILMKLQGSEAIEDIEESLKLFIYDNS